MPCETESIVENVVVVFFFLPYKNGKCAPEHGKNDASKQDKQGIGHIQNPEYNTSHEQRFDNDTKPKQPIRMVSVFGGRPLKLIDFLQQSDNGKEAAYGKQHKGQLVFSKTNITEQAGKAQWLNGSRQPSEHGCAKINKGGNPT